MRISPGSLRVQDLVEQAQDDESEVFDRVAGRGELAVGLRLSFRHFDTKAELSRVLNVLLGGWLEGLRVCDLVHVADQRVRIAQGRLVVEVEAADQPAAVMVVLA